MIGRRNLRNLRAALQEFPRLRYPGVYQLGGSKPVSPAPVETVGGTAPSAAAGTRDEEITITFWHTYGDSEEAQFLNVVMPLWEAAHPNIKVEAVRQDSSQYHQMIVTSFGTGMSPDVARVDIANIAAYAAQGGLTALSDYPDFRGYFFRFHGRAAVY